MGSLDLVAARMLAARLLAARLLAARPIATRLLAAGCKQGWLQGCFYKRFNLKAASPKRLIKSV